MSRQSTSRKIGINGLGVAGSSLPTALASAPAKSAQGSVEIKPGPDAVRRRAYELYMERIAKGLPGDDRADWLRAERDLIKS